MARYSSITIIFNPRSTGDGEKLARNLEKKLKKKLPKEPVTVVATEHAGHAEELAYEYAMASARPLIISASGDGGYNEVVNGLMRARKDGAAPTAGLLPGGNANDHFRSLHRGNLTDAIAAGTAVSIDLLELRTVIDGQPFSRYAHSYIGLGMTPQAGHELNKTELNRWNEVWIVTRVLFNAQPVRLTVDDTTHSYDSLVFSNIGTMSKFLTFSKASAPNDGRFEVIAFPSRTRLKRLATVFKASTRGLAGEDTTKRFVFKTVEPALVQLDGEVFEIDAVSRAEVTIEPAVLRCII
jgi:diacylglycerol kinase (ATP)